MAIYMNDVYLARGVTIGMSDLLDVGAIEIARGPRGTLQGRNANAGAILLRSADPTSIFERRVTAGLSDPLEFRAQAALSGPLGGFKRRIAAGYVNDRGCAYNPYNGQHIGGAKSYQARAVLPGMAGTPLVAALPRAARAAWQRKSRSVDLRLRTRSQK